MKIVVITGSPHKEGSSFLLTSEFIAGAEAQGNEVIRFDMGAGEVHACIGCDYCRKHDRNCIYRDAMDQIRPAILTPISWC